MPICTIRQPIVGRKIEERPSVASGADASGGEDREHQEVSILALHLLQSAMVLVNTMLLQNVLNDPAWSARLGPADRRALSQLFWTNIKPYGEIRLDMTRRLGIQASYSEAFLGHMCSVTGVGQSAGCGPLLRSGSPVHRAPSARASMSIHAGVVSAAVRRA